MNKQQKQESLPMETQTNRSLGTTISTDTPAADSSAEARLDTSFSDIYNSDCFSSKIKGDISLDNDSGDEETTLSITRTNGSSDNEYSLTQSPADLKPRSFSENDILITCKTGSDTENFTEDPEWLLTDGEYSDQYAVMKQIGKGAFGNVGLSYRRDNGLIVVTKFIKKSLVKEDRWTETLETGKNVCLEIDLLIRLNHPNIVKGLEYFENDNYFQLIMEKWGAGMDLFEFIERDPALDEPLVSYLFRQIVSPLLYLKSLNIIHRDIKDENIIINEQFHIKLIDFGSAAYLEEGKKFDQFAGTTEYCSPEVLKGETYSGPELEVWSLGITLYTIICGENPFNTADEILRLSFDMSSDYSKDLICLLSGMLKKNPKERMNLEEISDHKWNTQKVDLEMYSFEDIVSCSNEELSPPEYIAEAEGFEQSFCSTTSGFIYGNRRTHRSKEGSLLQSSNCFNISSEEPDKFAKNFKKSDEVASNSSRTSSLQSSSSLESLATIDSSVSFGSKNTVKRTSNKSSITDITKASYKITSETPSIIFSESKSTRVNSQNKRNNLIRNFSVFSDNGNSCSSTRYDISDVGNNTDDSASSKSDVKNNHNVFSICGSSSDSSSSLSGNSFNCLATVSRDFDSGKNTVENILS